MSSLLAPSADEPPARGASPASLRRPVLKHVSPRVADVVKRMTAHANAVRVPFGGAEFDVRLASVFHRLSGADAFTVSWAGEEVVIETQALWDVLGVPSAWWALSPGSLRAQLLAEALNPLGVARGVVVTYLDDGLPRDGAAESRELGLVCARVRDGRECLLRVHGMSPGGLSALAVLWSSMPAVGERSVPDVSFPVRALLLSTSLRAGELQALRRGALIPVGAPLEGRTIKVSIGWGKGRLGSGVLRQGVLNLSGGVLPMDESQTRGGIDLSQLSSMEDVEVQFTVELATCSLPLSELAKLSAGSTLNLGLPQDPTLVRICVNGKAVATGELVVLGNSLGVQVVDMASA